MSFRVTRAFLLTACAAIAWCGVLAAASSAGADTVTVVALTYGNPNDVPITGDWDGSGRTQIGAYRPSNRTFYLGDAGGVSTSSSTYGNPGDVPITGDWDGSGKTQIGVYRPSDDTFYLREVTPTPPPPPQVVTTPVTVPLPLPPRGTRRHPRVRVTIKISWTWNHRRTRIHKVVVGRLPRHARIALRCAGGGCPMKRRSARAAHVGLFADRLVGTTYRAGDRLLITVSAPGRISERARISIRDGRKPRAALL